MTKQAVLYARVSHDIQRDNYSIPTQIRACLAYASEREYIVVGDQYVDPTTGFDVESGDGALPAYVDDYTSRELNRPSLDALFRFIERNGCDVVIVHAIDRLARDPYIRRTLEMELERHRVKVEFVLGGYDETPEGEVRKDLDATFAKWENAKRVERVCRGKKGKAMRGLFVAGRVPYGYQMDEKAPSGLVVDEQQAAVVLRIFDLYVNQNKSLWAIVRQLSSEQVPTHSGTTSWAKSSVARILDNETYAGVNYFNKHARQGKRLVKRDKAEWIAIPVPPIVSSDLFLEAKEKRAESRESRRQLSHRFYLLSGMVYCAECKRVYLSQTERAGTYRRATDVQYYRHRVRQGHCMNRYLLARPLEDEVWGTIVSAILDADNLKKGYAQALTREESARAKLTSHLETLERAAIKLEQKRDNLTRAYVDPDIHLTKAEYLKQKSALDGEFDELATKIDEARQVIAEKKPPADLATFERFASEMRDILAQDIDPNPQEKRRILEMLHIKVWIEPDGKHQIKGWFQPGNSPSSTTSSRYARRQPPPPARA